MDGRKIYQLRREFAAPWKMCLLCWGISVFGPGFISAQTDEVYLHDGGVIAGLIIEEYPFEYIKVQKKNYQVITILNEDIQDIYRPLGIQGYWDVIYSKNGGILRGFIKEYYLDDYIIVENEREDTFEFPMAEILKITKEKTPPGEITQKSTINAKKARREERKALKTRNYSYTLYFAELGGIVATDGLGSNYPGFFVNQILSWQLNNRFGLGAGIGVDALYGLGGEPDQGRVIFADSRFYLSETKLRPWFSVSGGYDWFRKGWTASSGAGANIPVFKNWNLNLGAGIRIQQIGEESNNNNNLRGLLEMVQFRLVLD